MEKNSRSSLARQNVHIGKTLILDDKAEDVLAFWFCELEPEQWWHKDQVLDDKINKRFGKLHWRATLAELFKWRETPEGRLAEIILLDQFSRNIHRDKPLAFACDPMALALAQEAIAARVDEEIISVKRAFLYMPFMHSESILIQDESIHLFKCLDQESNLNYALRHRDVIAHFGRFPHRNKILGRDSTKEEEKFLNQPGSSF